MLKPEIIAHRNYTQNPDTEIFNMHSHETYEIYCFLKGSAKYFVEGNIYNLSPNDILIMKKAETHTLLINRCVPYERIVINFNNSALLDGVSDKILKFIDNRPLGCSNKYSAKIYNNNNWMNYLEKIYSSEIIEEKRLYLTTLLYEMCAEYPEHSEQNEPNNINKIIEYINNHLFDKITLDILSENFYLSKMHLTRKFKQFTGATVWEYITTKRLIYAKELLNNGMPPTFVFKNCGFSDYTTFYKSYLKHFGNSPKQDYFKRN